MQDTLWILYREYPTPLEPLAVFDSEDDALVEADALIPSYHCRDDAVWTKSLTRKNIYFYLGPSYRSKYVIMPIVHIKAG